MQNTIYKIEWKKAAEDNLNKIPSEAALKIYDRVESYLAQSPKELGKALVGKYSGLYRYRYGDYRIIYEIDKTNKILIINRVGHRSDVYSS